MNEQLSVVRIEVVMDSGIFSDDLTKRCCVEIYLFGVLRRFQHCTGHITMGSWKGRGNQYIEFARFVYCKLLKGWTF